MITDELEYVNFEHALICINDADLHPLLRSAYLDFVISAFVDYNVEESGTDIDNIWRSFVSVSRVTGRFLLLLRASCLTMVVIVLGRNYPEPNGIWWS